MAKNDDKPIPSRRNQPGTTRLFRGRAVQGDGIEVSCGKQAPGFCPEHSHPGWQIAFGFDGTDCVFGFVAGNGERMNPRIRSAVVFLIPPDASHEVQWRERADLIVIDLDVARVRAFCEHTLKEPSVRRLREYVRREPVIGALCESLRRNGIRGPKDETHVILTAMTLASFVLRAHFASERVKERKGPKLSDAEFEKVEKYMLEHVKEPFSLDKLAKVVNRTPTYFCRLFKARTHYRPREYFNRCRVLWAKEQIESGKLSPTNAAYSLDIYDLGYFGRLFRKFTGAPPSDFRPGSKR